MKAVVISSGDLHNIGDLALLLQCTFGVRAHIGAEQVWVRQWNTPDAQIVDQLDAEKIGVVAAKNLLGAAARARGALVMVGGGQMVRDNASVPSLASLAAMMEIAKLTGGASTVLACGVDRLTRNLHRRLWRRMMSGSTLVTVRDTPSQQAVAALCGDRADPVLTADLAFMPSPLHDALTAASDTPPSIVVAPCADHSENRTVAVDALCAAVVRAADALGVTTVSLVSHDARPNMDPQICGALAEHLAKTAPHLKVAMVASYVLADYTDTYATAALVITNRLHSLIFGLLARRPILVLDDGTAKTKAAAERFSIPLAPIDAPMSDALLAGLVAEAKAGPSPVRAAALDQAKQASRENFTRLASALGGRR